jgi:hypothetical protein
MCFSAVYLQHHYVSDVIAGTVYAALAYVIERQVSARVSGRRLPAAATAAAASAAAAAAT